MNHGDDTVLLLFGLLKRNDTFGGCPVLKSISKTFYIPFIKYSRLIGLYCPGAISPI